MIYFTKKTIQKEAHIDEIFHNLSMKLDFYKKLTIHYDFNEIVTVKQNRVEFSQNWVNKLYIFADDSEKLGYYKVDNLNFFKKRVELENKLNYFNAIKKRVELELKYNKSYSHSKYYEKEIKRIENDLIKLENRWSR